MITYTISNIPCNLFVLICHLPFNLHCCLNDLQIRTPTAFPIHLPVYLTFHLHHLTVQHLLGYHWQCDYICRYASQCNELFSYTANMKTHMIVHSRGKAKQMQRVQKIVLRSGHLKTHLLIYSEEKPHPCGQREESHREAESLNKHILHHTGENPHSCTECKRAFWQTGSISTHLLIHTGEKLHPCGQCDKSFTQSETLNKHLLWNCFFKVCWGDGGSGVGRGDRWGCGGGYMEMVSVSMK